MVVITGLKGQLALGKQTEASPSLPVGNFGLSCRVDAWETRFNSSLGEPNCSWRSAKAALGGGGGLLELGSLKARGPPLWECGPHLDTLDGDHLHQWFSFLAAQ